MINKVIVAGKVGDLKVTWEADGKSQTVFTLRYEQPYQDGQRTAKLFIPVDVTPRRIPPLDRASARRRSARRLACRTARATRGPLAGPEPTGLGMPSTVNMPGVFFPSHPWRQSVGVARVSPSPNRSEEAKGAVQEVVVFCLQRRRRAGAFLRPSVECAFTRMTACLREAISAMLPSLRSDLISRARPPFAHVPVA
jgi:hypothetical protein